MDTEGTASSPPGVLSPSAPQTSPAPAHLAAKQRDGRKTSSAAPGFLSNLGRATLRGIRKCPQCGVYNGTRGLSCKNKACGISLRNASSAAGRSGRKCAVDAVRVIIDSEERLGKECEGVRRGRGGGGGGGGGGDGGGGPSGAVQVFSVRHRGRGATPTQLGFVELVPTDTAIATGDGATLLTRVNLGRCFLPSCRQGQRSHRGEAESSAAAASKQPPDSLCAHIKQAMECRAFSTPLTLKSSVLDGLQASIQARKELWMLATESPGPLVQRVAKGTLVVKCHVDSQHPLGLLHLTVGAGGLLEGAKSERKGREPQHGVFHCACQAGGRRSKAGVDAAADSHPAPGGPGPSQPCLHFYACVCAFASDEKLASEFAAFIKYTPNGVPHNAVGPSEQPRHHADPTSPLLKTKKLRLEESLPGSAQVVDERAVTLGFHQWLAGVTERIHQTMHYQFDGKPQPLVYHIPQEFFSALLHRLSLASKKKRLPNLTSAIVRNDELPLGSFSKYTWHITSLTQVKRVFDTSEVPLELTQSFVRNADGSYSRFRCPEPPPPPAESEPAAAAGPRTERPQAIRPMELRTFLKVGPTAEQPEAGPFVIEWIPDALPRCRMGELSIGFQFGHQQSGGRPESCEKTGAAERAGRGRPDPPAAKHPQAVEIIRVVV